MAAPTPTTRATPAGIMLRDGFSSKVTIGIDPDISVWEKTAKPPGIDGGDAVDQTTMHNTDYTTSAPQYLKTLTESTFKFSYDPAIYTQLMAVINVRTTITQSFRDGTTVAYYGFVQKAEFDELVRGTQPEGTMTIMPTNWDHINSVEAGPTVTSVAGS